jgi:uncharacterized protein (TIGR02246 family)
MSDGTTAPKPGGALEKPCLQDTCTAQPLPCPDRTQSADRQSPPGFEVELALFNTAFIGVFDAGNGQELAALFTEDAIVMNTLGRIVSGRDAIMAALEHSFAGPCQGATLQITPIITRAVTENVVVQQGTTRTTRKTDPPTHRDFYYTKVFVRQDSVWKLAAAQFTNADPASAPPAQGR